MKFPIFRSRTVALAPVGPTPSPRQLRWHDMEVYGFIHFTVNTFTDREWGLGDESPAVFQPTDFDADQIADAAAQGGLEGLILTCKHHDGFCLWPSRYTDHSVRNSPWRAGGGDVVRDVSEACRRRGLRFGVYLSPWDRHHAAYGRSEYLSYYRNQLEELTSEYGELFEVWFDGANGGNGYYGGANEERRIDRKTYYEWETTWDIVRRNQPNAVIFSDAGPDVRWVGNEKGIAGNPCWATFSKTGLYPGLEGGWEQLSAGDRAGTDWLPAECDVSIRPGWFYHATEDDQVRSPENLLDLYFQSVGRGASLLLNLPPDRRGRIHERDLASLTAFRRRLHGLFERNGADNARIRADSVRKPNRTFRPEHLIDGDPGTFWAAADGHLQTEVVLDFSMPVSFNVIRLRENIAFGQRVNRFAVDVEQAGAWMEYLQAEAIGNRRILKGNSVTTRRIRLRILDAIASPVLTELALFFDPQLPAQNASNAPG
ncbi:MAG: alpha-L-fucosidase [Kiritimatiellia bacterium]|nr:alpha-L-fucosidase [Kiritimatiellia bacterium]